MWMFFLHGRCFLRILWKLIVQFQESIWNVWLTALLYYRKWSNSRVHVFQMGTTSLGDIKIRFREDTSTLNFERKTPAHGNYIYICIYHITHAIELYFGGSNVNTDRSMRLTLSIKNVSIGGRICSMHCLCFENMQHQTLFQERWEKCENLLKILF